MAEATSNPRIEQAVEGIIDALDGVYELPTHDFAAFDEEFHSKPSRDYVTNRMFALVDALGQPLEPRNKREAILHADRTQTHLAKKLNGYRFGATASVWGADDEYRYREVELRASTPISLPTRQRSVWGLKMRADNVDSSGEIVWGASYDPTVFDEATFVQYAMWQNPRGLKSTPHPSRNTYTLPDSEDRPKKVWESDYFRDYETPIDRAVRESQPQPKTPPAERTPEGIPILQSSEINRRIQLFRDNFFDLNLMLLAAAGTPIAIEFIQEQEAKTETGLRLVPPLPPQN